jgi:uncharacterized damage-inducible protein DinB
MSVMSDSHLPTFIASAFTGYATGRLDDCLSNIERCVGLLTLEQVWRRPNDVSNSVGNLVLHLTGNVTQWINAGLGGDRFDRDRPAEFSQRDPIPVENILPPLRKAMSRACDLIEALTPEELARDYPVQGRTVTGLAAVFHVVEHLSFHTGQIVSTTKLFTGRDLSLYDPQGQRTAPLRGRSV